MKILDKFINPLIDKEVDKRIEALIKESQEHNSVMVGNPLAWTWASTIPDSYYPNAVLRDGTRTLTGDLTAADGIKINIDEIRARDAGGLKLFEDSGVGIFVKDGGNVGIGTTEPNSALEVYGVSKQITITRSVADTNYGQLLFNDGVDINWAIGQRDGDANFHFWDEGGGAYDVMVIETSTGDVGIGTISPDRKIHSEKLSALTNTIQQVVRLTHITSGTPAAGIGLGLEFEQETANDNNEIIAILESVMTDVTGASEDADFVVKLMAGGAAAAEKLRVTSDGYVKPSVGYKSGAGNIMFDVNGYQESGAKTRQLLAFGYNAAITENMGSTTIDCNTVDGSSNEYGYRIIRAGKVTGLSFQCNVTAQSTTSEILVTVQKNAVDQGMTITLEQQAISQNIGAITILGGFDVAANDKITVTVRVKEEDSVNFTVDDIAVLVEIGT